MSTESTETELPKNLHLAAGAELARRELQKLLDEKAALEARLADSKAAAANLADEAEQLRRRRGQALAAGADGAEQTAALSELRDRIEAGQDLVQGLTAAIDALAEPIKAAEGAHHIAARRAGQAAIEAAREVASEAGEAFLVKFEELERAQYALGAIEGHGASCPKGELRDRFYAVLMPLLKRHQALLGGIVMGGVRAPAAPPQANYPPFAREGTRPVDGPLGNLPITEGQYIDAVSGKKATEPPRKVEYMKELTPADAEQSRR